MKLYRFVSSSEHGFDRQSDGRHLPAARGPWCVGQTNPIDTDVMSETGWQRIGVDPLSLFNDIDLHGYHLSPRGDV